MDRERVVRTLTFWPRPEFVLGVVDRFQEVAGFDSARWPLAKRRPSAGGGTRHSDHQWGKRAMSSPIVPSGAEVAADTSGARVLALAGEPRWWLWLVTGLIWTIAALVILQFDAASVATISVIVGCMFLFSGAQQIVFALLADHPRWLSIGFGVLFIAAAGVCFANPEDTFRGLADVLGFLFLLVGIWWMIEALLVRGDDSLWWLGLTAGILMILLAFWTSGQFFVERAYTLLIFAGIWALMQGITDIVRAFQIRGWTAQG